MLFCSGYKGFALFHEFLYGALRDIVKVVGVATDDPDKPWCNPQGRVWRYPHTEIEKNLVKDAAARHSIPAWTGRIRSTEFLRTFETEWQPDLLLVSVFGQKIPQRLISYPRLAAWNLHPSGEEWPTFEGPRPYEEMLAKGVDHFYITLHVLDEDFDHGRRVACSRPIWIPPGVTVKNLHKMSAAPSAAFAADQVALLLKSRRLGEPEGVIFMT